MSKWAVTSCKTKQKKMWREQYESPPHFHHPWSKSIQDTKEWRHLRESKYVRENFSAKLSKKNSKTFFFANNWCHLAKRIKLWQNLWVESCSNRAWYIHTHTIEHNSTVEVRSEGNKTPRIRSDITCWYKEPSKRNTKATTEKKSIFRIDM